MFPTKRLDYIYPVQETLKRYTSWEMMGVMQL